MIEKNIISTYSVDAVVYVCMGKMTTDPLVDYSIASLRKLGEFQGEIYIITDVPNCFDTTILTYNISVIQVPSMETLMEIKSLKPNLFKHLPTRIQSVLYLDVDIVVTKSLNSFFRELTTFPPNIISPGSLKQNQNFDFGSFYDSKSHFIGWCSGCEKWHTGIIWLKRRYGEKCLQSWSSIILSGKYDTDQQSLDDSEIHGECHHITAFNSRHLLFAKDYLGWIFTSDHTFLHVTAAGRAEDQDSFYRDLVIPRIHQSLPIPTSILKTTKTCKS